MLLISKILLGLATLLGLLQFKQTRTRFHKTVLLLLIAAAWLLFIELKAIKTIGLGLYHLMLLVFIVHSFVSRKSTVSKKVLIGLVTILPLLQGIFMFQYWPYVAHLMLLQVVSVVSFLIILRNNEAYKNELGILTIIAMEAFLNVLIFLGGF